MDLDLSQFRDAFLDECEENALEVEAGLLALEKRPDDDSRVHALFRAVHSIKGGCGTFGLQSVEGLTHAMESALDAMREGRAAVDGPRVSLLLRANDALRGLLADARDGEGGDAAADDELVAALRAAATGDPVADDEALGDRPPSGTGPGGSPAPPEADTVAPAVTGSTGSPAAPAAPAAGGEGGTTLRVATEKVDELVNLVGELVIAQSAVRRQFDALAPAGGEALSSALDGLQASVHDLQQRALSVRMVPVGTLFGRLDRLVRDTAAGCGKPVELEAVGGETELDKTIVEHLAEPLTHLVRNAVDHGLEDGAGRRAAGKPPTGVLRLSARHDGGAVIVEIADDGRGLDAETIRARAERAGLLTPGEALPPEVLHELIFAPGFSTKDAVTEVSGRGVGLDVVRNHLAALNGSVTVSSTPGAGTTFRMRLPLTLAIIDGLLVGVGARTYVLPVHEVVETTRPGPGDLRRILGKGEVLVLRGSPLPLLPLGRLLAEPEAVDDATDGLAVVVEHAGERSALLVDRLLDRQEFVIRNLETHYARVEGLMGGAVMGDGSIALILDVGGLHRLHRRASTAPESPHAHREARA